VSIPSVLDVIAAFFTAAEPEPGADRGEVCYGPCDRLAGPEPEAEP